jgi:hypothetical protein
MPMSETTAKADADAFRNADDAIAGIERMAGVADHFLTPRVIESIQHPDFDRGGKIRRDLEQLGRIADAMETFVATVRRVQHVYRTKEDAHDAHH